LSTKSKSLTTILLLLLAGGFYLSSMVKLPLIDAEADAYFTESIKTATLAYATIRGVNAVVSVLKESEIEVSPAGVGINIAAGQILDPIDDMTERLSDVVVASIVSLGIQKVGYEIGEALSFKAIAVLLLLIIPALWIGQKWSSKYTGILLKLGLILLLLRFLLPAASLLNDAFYQKVLKERIDHAVDNLTIVSTSYQDLSTLEEREDKKDGGFLSSITGPGDGRIARTKQAFFRVIENVEQIIESLLELTTLYAIVFLMQILVIPLAILWLLIRILHKPMFNDMTANWLNPRRQPETSAEQS
jgi:hypothetical protein